MTNRDFEDDAFEDERREQRAAQAEHNRNSYPPSPKARQIARLFRGQDCPDQYTCDIIFVDRLTGHEVFRFDAADPANTNPYYGAEPDSVYLANLGYDISEMIDPAQAVIAEYELRQLCRVSYEDDYDNYYEDDGWDDGADTVGYEE